MSELIGKILGGVKELSKWAPVLATLEGLFGDPKTALKAIRKWEIAERRKTDAMFEAAKAKR